MISEMVDIVVATGTEGEFGVLYNHIPFLSTLAPGELRYRIDGSQHLLAVTGGFAEVLPDKVTILAEAAEVAREIDISRAQKARERAQARLAKAKSEEMDHVRAEAAPAQGHSQDQSRGKIRYRFCLIKNETLNIKGGLSFRAAPFIFIMNGWPEPQTKVDIRRLTRVRSAGGKATFGQSTCIRHNKYRLTR